MTDLRDTESKIPLPENRDAPLHDLYFGDALVQRGKPGPQKKIAPRSEKESCRLTKAEKVERRNYCQKYGIKPADLLRAAYLSATISEAKRGKVFFDTSIILRELEVSAGKMKQRIGYGGKPVTASELATLRTGIIAVLKNLTVLVPLVICSTYFLLFLGADGVAETGGTAKPLHELAWLYIWRCR